MGNAGSLREVQLDRRLIAGGGVLIGIGGLLGFTGMLLVRAWHASRGDTKRTKVLVPDSAHGTNPASVHAVGWSVD